MNEKLNDELILLEEELNRLDNAVKDIETAKEVSTNVVQIAKKLTEEFSLFYQKLDSSFKEIKNQHSNILNDYSKKFNIEVSQVVESAKNELDSANVLINQNLDRFDEKTKNIVEELMNLLTKNEELNDKLEALFKEFDDLHLPLKLDKLDSTISAISQAIQNVQGRLDTIEANIIRATDNQQKKVLDEMEMVTLGMNNINHSMEDKFANSDEQFKQLKKENKILFILTAILLIAIIAQFFI